MAGCILIDFEKMQVINRSPAYRNQYVHRRDSVSLAMLSEAEIAERVKLGLITADSHAEDDDEIEEEEWEEFDEDDDPNASRDYSDGSDEEYVWDDRRKSSVDPSKTMTSPPDSSHDNHDVSMEGNVNMQPKRIDFSGVDSSNRRNNNRLKFASITEANEDEEEGSDEESTVNGEYDDATMEGFEDARCAVTVDGY
jgi:hypothetical protein